jgi:protein O-mannosyl-transferase
MSRANRTRQMAWDVGVPVAVALATVAVFLPALWNGFVWDDLPMFPHNPHYRGLGLTQLRWMWTTFHIREFMPFTWMTYGLDYVLWGVEPFGYHLSNLFLHALSAVAVYFVARRLLRLGMSESAGDPAWMIPLGAGVATLIFAVHPLRAEPVAWVAARGSILGGLFFVLTTLAYLAAVARPGGPRRGPFLASLGFFVLALLSRSTTIIVPIVLLVLDVYPLRRLGGGPGRWVGPPVRHVLWEKVPFMVLAAAMVPLALLARYEAGPMMGQRLGDVHVGAATAVLAIAFYLVKTLVPAALSPLYERPPHLDPLTWPSLASGAGVVVITALLLALRRRWPAGLASWLCYLAILGPTLGLIPFGLQLAADRYTPTWPASAGPCWWVPAWWPGVGHGAGERSPRRCGRSPSASRSASSGGSPY